jgi:acyl dehydratase
LGRWKITKEWVTQYLEAVGDPLPHYMELGIVPPLAISALALGNLLKGLALPGGAIHSLQEVNTIRAVRLGEELVGRAGLERPRRRGNLQFITACYLVRDAAGNEVQQGKSTVLVSHSDDP